MAGLTQLMNQGMSAVISAGGENANGAYFPIRYFLPIYDPRMDDNIHTEGVVTSAQDFSATVDITDTTDSIKTEDGHIIYNDSGYTISSAEVLILNDVATSGVGGLSGSDVSDVTTIALLSGTPTMPIFSGGTPSMEPDATLGEWVLNGATSAAEVNTTGYLSDHTKYFTIDSFSPIGSGTSGSNNVMRGLYKCRMGNDVGNFKFNKIAVFTVDYNIGTGAIITANKPNLFAIAGFNSVIEKTTDGFNLANVEIDVELEFSSSATFEPLVYMTNDYWTQVPTVCGDEYGLYTDRDVAVGSSGTGWNPAAKIESTDTSKPQLRLSYDQTVYADFEVGETGGLSISGSGTAATSDVSIDSTNGTINIGTKSTSQANIELRASSLLTNANVINQYSAGGQTITAGADININGDEINIISSETNNININSHDILSLSGVDGVNMIANGSNADISISADRTIDVVAERDMNLWADVNLDIESPEINISATDDLVLRSSSTIDISAVDDIDIITNDNINLSATNDIFMTGNLNYLPESSVLVTSGTNLPKNVVAGNISMVNIPSLGSQPLLDLSTIDTSFDAAFLDFTLRVTWSDASEGIYYGAGAVFIPTTSNYYSFLRPNAHGIGDLQTQLVTDDFGPAKYKVGSNLSSYTTATGSAFIYLSFQEDGVNSRILNLINASTDLTMTSVRMNYECSILPI